MRRWGAALSGAAPLLSGPIMRSLPTYGRKLAGEDLERAQWSTTAVETRHAQRRRHRRVEYGDERESELDRVCNVPRYPGPSDATVEALLERIVYPECPDHVTLLDTQILALATLVETRSLAGFITTGAGKTLILLLAMKALGLTRGVGLIRPDLIEQAVDEVEEFAGSFAFDGRLNLVSYGVLQHWQYERLLWDLRPQIIVADEAHELGNRVSARWIRVRDYCADYPDTIFVPISGSLSTSGILDYAHLLELALGDKCPFPRRSEQGGDAELKRWARCLASEGIPQRTDIPSIADLGSAFGAKSLSRVDTLSAWQSEIRGAYSRRLASTPGVLVIDKASWPGLIRIEEHRNPELPEEIRDAVEGILATGESPDGAMVFADDDEANKAVSELVCGFWYRWDWPESIAPDERLSWRLARADWSRFVRHEIKERGRVGYDSRMKVAGAVARQIKGQGGEADLPIEVAYLDWLKWREQLRDRLEAIATRDNRGSGVKPPTTAVWVSSYLVDDCVRWLDEHDPAVLWYRHRAFGDALEEAGVTAYNTRKRRVGLSSILKRRGPHNAALPFACAVGRNLQAYSVMRTAGVPPSNSKAWEQLLGRFARKGQRSDTILMHVDATNKHAKQALERARRGAAGVEEREGIKQKLLSAERTIVK